MKQRDTYSNGELIYAEDLVKAYLSETHNPFGNVLMILKYVYYLSTLF
jgi:hypothetical protein